MQDSVLIDADVILDFFFDRTPFAEFATEVLALCENKEIKGHVTPVIISNVYYLLRKTAKHKPVIEKLKQLVGILEVVKMDKKVIIDALNSDFKPACRTGGDFEDALQNFSAQRNGSIGIVVTRNVKDFKKSELVVMTPEIYLKGRVNR